MEAMQRDLLACGNCLLNCRHDLIDFFRTLKFFGNHFETMVFDRRSRSLAHVFFSKNFALVQGSYLRLVHLLIFVSKFDDGSIFSLCVFVDTRVELLHDLIKPALIDKRSATS